MIITPGHGRPTVSAIDHLTETENATEIGTGSAIRTETVLGTVTESVIATGSMIGPLAAVVVVVVVAAAAAALLQVLVQVLVEEEEEEEEEDAVVADGQMATIPIRISTPSEIGRWRNVWDYNRTRMANRGAHHGRIAVLCSTYGTTSLSDLTTCVFIKSNLSVFGCLPHSCIHTMFTLYRRNAF